MGDQEIRDRIAQIESTRNISMFRLSMIYFSVIAFASLSLVILIFHLSQENPPPQFIILFGLVFSGCMLFLGFNRPKFKEDKEIDKLYELLIKKNK